ncbi:MAG: hypothetical protein ACTSRP_03545 [Candidatus Helarchaeota archaeon]
MSHLLDKINGYIEIEEKYSNFEARREYLKNELDNLERFIKRANDFRALLQELFRLIKNIEIIIPNLNLKNKDIKLDLKEIIKRIDGSLKIQNFNELNERLTEIENIFKTLKRELTNYMLFYLNDLENYLFQLEKLCTISDLEKMYNEIGLKIFKKNNDIIQFLKKNLMSLKRMLKPENINIVIAEYKDFLEKLNIFKQQSNDISDISKISKKHNLTEETTTFLLSIINQGYASMNLIDINILRELEKNFSDFKKNLIITLTKNKE